VRVAGAPPGAELGLTLSAVSAGCSVSDAEVLAPASVAVIEPDVEEAT
jgi:hypothetical protein